MIKRFLIQKIIPSNNTKQLFIIMFLREPLHSLLCTCAVGTLRREHIGLSRHMSLRRLFKAFVVAGLFASLCCLLLTGLQSRPLEVHHISSTEVEPLEYRESIDAAHAPPAEIPPHKLTRVRSVHQTRPAFFSSDILFLEDSCEAMGALMGNATLGSWPKSRQCEPGQNISACAVKFHGGPPDGFGSQMYKRMAHFHDGVQFGCGYIPSSLATKNDRESKLFNLLAHGVSPNDIDRTFGLTSAARSILAKAKKTGLEASCPSDEMTANALDQNLPADAQEGAITSMRDYMAGKMCIEKRPLLRYKLASFDANLWLRGRAVLRDLFFAAPGIKGLKQGTGNFHRHRSDAEAVLGSTLGTRVQRSEITIAVHIREGDVDQHHFRHVPLRVWRRAGINR